MDKFIKTRLGKAAGYEGAGHNTCLEDCLDSHGAEGNLVKSYGVSGQGIRDFVEMGKKAIDSQGIHRVSMDYVPQKSTEAFKNTIFEKKADGTTRCILCNAVADVGHINSE